MSGKVRPALFLVGAVGFVCLGYAFAFGLEHGFSLNWEGNWDPVVIGLVGTALLAAAATADAVLKRVGISGRGAIARSVARALATSLLTFVQYGGVFLAMWGFTLFLAFARAEQDAAAPLALTIVGIVMNRLGAFFLPRVRERRAEKETFVSKAEDDDDP